jgi:hypothetical protein
MGKGEGTHFRGGEVPIQFSELGVLSPLREIIVTCGIFALISGFDTVGDESLP